MQQGWAFRRALERDAGRAALRRAAASGVAPPATFVTAANDLERLAYLVALVARDDAAAVDEIGELAFECEGLVRFAARAALEACIRRRMLASGLTRSG